MQDRKLMFHISPNLRVWTQAEKEKVRDMFFEGYTDAEIGEKIGRTPHAVGLQRCYMGFKKLRQPQRRFEIHDAMADYYPDWYKKQLKEQWNEQYTK